MLVNIKIKQKLQSKLKNKGMHLGNHFVKMEIQEFDIDKKFLDSDQCKHWMEYVEVSEMVGDIEPDVEPEVEPEQQVVERFEEPNY